MTPDRLAQEIEAVLDMRDPGLLVGEFETPLLQELCHERFDSIFDRANALKFAHYLTL
jgi:hypothetical protein